MSLLGKPGMRRRLFLMRHSSVEYFDASGQPLDPRNVCLTAEGEVQAAHAAQALTDVSFDLALCSGLPRTWQTAQIVLGAREVELEVEPRFKEIRSGRLRELFPAHRDQQIAYTYEYARLPEGRFLGGETFSAFSERVLAAWNVLLARPWSQALVVAHDAVNRVLMSQVASGNSLGCLEAFEQDPACINVIDLDIHLGQLRRAMLRTVNYTPYDAVKRQRHLTVMEQVSMRFKG